MGVSACSLLNACRTLRPLLLPAPAWSARRFLIASAQELEKEGNILQIPRGAVAEAVPRRVIRVRGANGLPPAIKRLCLLMESQALISGGKSDWTG